VKTADPADALAAAPARAAFVAAMQRPAAYVALHAVSAPVRCVETHISWVFLTGPYAYKVKKPLRLTFLDYSSTGRREFLCHEELRLNRRHAPGLYVDVVAIGGTPDAPRVGATSEPAFEHALRMVQFDPDDELSRRLQRGAVTRAEVVDLGQGLAQMHRDAAVAAADSRYGEPTAVHRVTLDNLDELDRLLRDARQRERLARVRDDLERSFAHLREALARRKQEGRVRECHGDLHCGNVVRWHDRLVAFDGLEFDPALRYVDVANDLAFLSMDLACHGRADLRGALLDAWTAAGGDYGAIETLPYYESHRALVRAKVAALRARQTTDPASAAKPVRRYLEWASDRLRRRPPTLIVMLGLSGSGKTWMAHRIAGHIGALQVRSDVERKRLAGLGPLERSASAPDSGLYTREFNARTYARLRECVRHALRGGEHLVLDAANLRQDEREAFVRIAAELGAPVRLVHCHAPAEVLRERVAVRSRAGTDASEATPELLDRQAGCWEPLTEAERAITLDVDTRQAEAVGSVLAELRRLATEATD
jgi:aminoglycoside phosphotransferase family enzyme/predicted kinase